MLTNRRADIAARLEIVRTDAESMIAAEDFNPASETYVALKREADSLVQQLGEIDAALVARASTPTLITASGSAATPADDTPTSVGEMVVRSGNLGTYSGSGRHTLVERAPLYLTSGTGTPWKTTDRITQAQPAFITPLTDQVTQITISSNNYEWVVNGAIPTISAATAEGGTKPEATISASLTSGSLETLAHWAQASRQLLEDSAAAQEFINTNLIRGVARKIESNVAATILASGTTLTGTGNTLLKAIRKGLGNVQDAGFMPNVVLLNPADWADLDIAVMGSTLIGPNSAATFWGLQPVTSSLITAGTAIVGNVGDAITLLKRNEVNVYVTDSHASTFISNVFTILAETRCKAVATQPQALAVCTVTV